MKLIYIVAQAPYGRGETFINDEMLSIKDKIKLFIFPRNPEKEVFHKEAKVLKDYTIRLPLINIRMFFYLLLFLILKPKTWGIIINLFKHSRTKFILIKNLIVLPKGVYISKIINEMKIDHIHAHWGSTTSTIAYIVSQLTGIPWSFTLHRWDISENNMLKEKTRTAKFVRVISKDGYKEVLEIIGNEYKNKCVVLHMGVGIPKFIKSGKKTFERDKDGFNIAIPANLVEKKGHKYLIKAIETLKKKGYNNIKCHFFGDGLLREELEKIVNKMNMENFIVFKGAIPHEKLLELYSNREIDCVVLPSIITEDGEKEGIPVSLMEAMAYKIPVVSTNTGGIPELLDNDAGIMVEQKNSCELAEAIEVLIRDKELRFKLGEKGYKKVMEEFYLPNIVTKLLEFMRE
jgi:glycosyltransferase involved in cell wall biosynthesis